MRSLYDRSSARNQAWALTKDKCDFQESYTTIMFGNLYKYNLASITGATESVQQTLVAPTGYYRQRLERFPLIPETRLSSLTQIALTNLSNRNYRFWSLKSGEFIERRPRLFCSKKNKNIRSKEEINPSKTIVLLLIGTDPSPDAPFLAFAWFDGSNLVPISI